MTHVSQVKALSSTLIAIADEDNGLAFEGLKRGVLLIIDLGRHIETWTAVFEVAEGV